MASCWGSHSMSELQLCRAAVCMHHLGSTYSTEVVAERCIHVCTWTVDRLVLADAGQQQKFAGLSSCFLSGDAKLSIAVYALLGLTTWRFENQPLLESSKPDYGKNINEVVADATKLATEEAGDLYLFRHRSRRGTPS